MPQPNDAAARDQDDDQPSWRRWIRRETFGLLAGLLLLVGPVLVGQVADQDPADAAVDVTTAERVAARRPTTSTTAEPTTTTTAAPTTTTTAAPTTTTAAPTTTTTAPPPPPPPAPAPDPSVAADSGGAVPDPYSYATWDTLAQCESTGNWAINTGNGFYGGVQFSLQSWQAVGGTGYPHEASRETQITMAIRLWEIQGWVAWPACTAELGWR
jgi:type II secretory pathway pseudopilin PulG